MLHVHTSPSLHISLHSSHCVVLRCLWAISALLPSFRVNIVFGCLLSLSLPCWLILLFFEASLYLSCIYSNLWVPGIL